MSLRARASRSPITVTELAPIRSAVGINERGQVIGVSYVGSLTSVPQPVLWDRGVAVRLAPADGGIPSRPRAVSERGQVVGTTVGFPLAFSWSGGVWTLLTPPVVRGHIGSADAVNDRGLILGSRIGGTAETVVWHGAEVVASLAAGPAVQDRPKGITNHGLALVDVGRRAAVWRVAADASGVTELGTLGGATSTGADINESGTVVGASDTAGGRRHAFRWRRGRMVDLGTLGGPTSSAVEINERGHVAGVSETAAGERHACLWRGGGMIDLGTLGGGTSRAVALNDRGQVVGVSETVAGEQHAFLWQHGRMVDLGALAGHGPSEATDVNDRGQVTGSIGSSADRRALLWTAPPGRG